VPVAEAASVSSSYFDVLKIPLKRGRVFTELDNSKGRQVAVINEALARRYWPGADPVGQRIKLGRTVEFRSSSYLTIVGVVGDVRSDGFDTASAPSIYVSEPQAPPYVSVVYLRTADDPGTLGEAIRHEVQAVDPGVPVYGIRTMDELVGKNLAARRFALELVGVFAAVAFVIAAIGIYGVMAYTFSRRTSEIGLRMALGAQRIDILRIVLGEGARMVVFGVLAGLIGSAILTRFLQTLLFEIKPTDPITFGVLTALLVSVALLACLIPAQRASRLDPLMALRHE
jgi:putative ABC transport system permease protein